MRDKPYKTVVINIEADKIDPEVIMAISESVASHYMQNTSISDLFWHIWTMINHFSVQKKIDALGYRILMDKLNTFITYISK